MIWNRFYRCRNCGKEFTDDYDFDYEKGKTIDFEEWIIRGFIELNFTGKNGEVIHKCKPGQYGIADYIRVRSKSVTKTGDKKVGENNDER